MLLLAYRCKCSRFLNECAVQYKRSCHLFKWSEANEHGCKQQMPGCSMPSILFPNQRMGQASLQGSISQASRTDKRSACIELDPWISKHQWIIFEPAHRRIISEIPDLKQGSCSRFSIRTVCRLKDWQHQMSLCPADTNLKHVSLTVERQPIKTWSFCGAFRGHTISP